ncbi:hypothetical protein F5B19DRAFT_490780 [Rostrohypoxylon terebratum]|nr:hypothetical protein F5B19DRAFT_490780 [Rostrohypoxylon terebratum]
MDRKVTAEYIMSFFHVARQLVGRCGKLQPHQFWGEVGSHLAWARSLSGGDLLDFANRVISARNSFNNSFQFYRECNCKPEDIPEQYKEQVKNELHQAIQDWVASIHETYGPYSDIRQLYYPQWLVDSDNEGTAEATNSKFIERIEDLKQQKRRNNDKAEDTTDVAKADNQNVKMESCEEHDIDQGNEDDEGNEDEAEDDDVDGEQGDVQMLDEEDENQTAIVLPFRSR